VTAVTGLRYTAILYHLIYPTTGLKLQTRVLVYVIATPEERPCLAPEILEDFEPQRLAENSLSEVSRLDWRDEQTYFTIAIFESFLSISYHMCFCAKKGTIQCL
jgi:hypothetical protein